MESKKAVLITGGAGYIGSHTAVELIGSGYEVIVVDNLSNSNSSSIDGIEKITGVRPAFEEVDEQGPDEVIKETAKTERCEIRHNCC